MKLGKGMILGTFLVLLGLSIILKAVFHIDLPFVRISFALLLIYFGVRMLTGSVFSTGKCLHKNTVLFSENRFDSFSKNSSENQYNVVFGKGTIDLTKFAPDQGDIHFQTNVVFGEGTVLIHSNTPVFIQSNSAFGEARMPDNNLVAFGTLNYQSPNFKADKPSLRIHGNVAFGSLKFKLQDATESR